MEDHPVSAVHDCLFHIFAAAFHIWRSCPPSAIWGHAMPGLGHWRRNISQGCLKIRAGCWRRFLGLTYLITLWSRVLLEKLTSSHLVKKFLAFYKCPPLVSFLSQIKITEDPSQYYPSIYAWVFQVVSFPPVAPRKTCIHLPIRATCPAQIILLDFSTRKILGEWYRSLNSSFCLSEVLWSKPFYKFWNFTWHALIYMNFAKKRKTNPSLTLKIFELSDQGKAKG